MEKKTTVVVIGGGYFGAAITYQLAKQGIKVILVEKDELGCGSSGGNFGCVQVQDASPGISLDLTLKSFEMWQKFKEELNADIEYRSRGHLIVAANEREWSNLLAIQKQKEAQGLKYRILDSKELAAIEPAINPASVVGATYYLEAAINPFKLINTLVRRARENGAELYENVEVLDLVTANKQVTEVITDKGVIKTDYVVLAAGAWTKSLGEKIGLNLPVHYIKAEAFVSEVLPVVLNNYYSSASFFDDAHSDEGSSTALCVNQTKSGNLLIGQTSSAPKKPIEEETKHNNTAEHCFGIYEKIKDIFPSFLKYKIIRSWQTFSPYTESLLPVYGQVGYDNLIVASGFKSAAIMVPLVGQGTADLITKGKANFDLESFSLKCS